MKTKLLILSMALAFPSLAAWAQAPRGPGHNPPPAGPHDGHGPEVHDDPHRNPMFHSLLRALDTDGDGVISMTEMNHAAESLLKLDKNGDGELNHSELCPPPHHKDGPKDGKEEKGDKPDKGDKLDQGDKPADKDNPKDGDGDKKPRGGDGPKDHNDEPKEDEQRSALVDAIDTNHDGRISADEIAAARANLKKLDLNHDGKLSPGEYGQHRHP